MNHDVALVTGKVSCLERAYQRSSKHNIVFLGIYVSLPFLGFVVSRNWWELQYNI